MAKSGTEYELFVKEVYESLNKADGLTDVEIQHDVKLEGAAGVEHQIDVFWSFKKGGISEWCNRICQEIWDSVDGNTTSGGI